MNVFQFDLYEWSLVFWSPLGTILEAPIIFLLKDLEVFTSVGIDNLLNSLFDIVIL